jgi:hypothetical protein
VDYYVRMTHELSATHSDLAQLVERALGDKGFRSLTVLNPEQSILRSGSYREKSAYSHEMQTNVYVIETYTRNMYPDDDVPHDLHRLGVAYDDPDDTIDEICLDKGYIVDDGSIDIYDVEQARVRILKALGAIIGEA